MKIYYKKSKVLMLSVGAFALMLGSLYVLVLGAYGMGINVAMGLLIVLLGLVSTTFFVTGFFGLAGFLLSKKPALEIDDLGITDHSAVISMGRTLWSEIEMCGIENSKGKPVQINWLLTKERKQKLSFVEKMAVKMTHFFGFDYDFGTNFNLLNCEPEKIVEAIGKFKKLR